MHIPLLIADNKGSWNRVFLVVSIWIIEWHIVENIDFLVFLIAHTYQVADYAHDPEKVTRIDLDKADIDYTFDYKLNFA